MVDQKSEWTDGRCFGWQQLPANSIENFISGENKWIVAALYLQSIKTFLTLWVSIGRAVARFPQASRSRAAATGDVLEMPCVCACSSVGVWSAQAVQERCPIGLVIDFAAKTFDCLEYLLESGIALWSNCQMTSRAAGAWTWTQTLPSDQCGVKVLCAPKPQNNLCGVWILVKVSWKRWNWGQWQVDTNPLLLTPVGLSF